jgi:8-oxo-dGTP diphosphatase
MTKYEFRVVVKALITEKGEVLLGRKEEDDDHEIGGEWHILGGHLEKGEQVEEAVKREVKEETGLDVEVHQIVDTSAFAWGGDEKDAVQIVLHCEAEDRDAEPRDDLQEVRWVPPAEVKGQVHSGETERIEEREELEKFLKRIEKAPY